MEGVTVQSVVGLVEVSTFSVPLLGINIILPPPVY
jgi:hypothetical protein